jgi:hypothetical protein
MLKKLKQEHSFNYRFRFIHYFACYSINQSTLPRFLVKHRLYHTVQEE